MSRFMQLTCVPRVAQKEYPERAGCSQWPLSGSRLRTGLRPQPVDMTLGLESSLIESLPPPRRKPGGGGEIVSVFL